MAITHTTELYTTLVKTYMPMQAMRQAFVKRDWLMSELVKRGRVDNNWPGGTLEIPFEKNGASSIQMGSLPDEDDISSFGAVKGSVSDHKEMWASMKWTYKDLKRHGDPKKSFLAKLPGELKNLLARMKEQTSLQLLNGAHVDIATVAPTTGGVVAVSYPERREIDEKLTIQKADASANMAVYVIAIDINAKTITLSDSRGGSAYNLQGAGYLISSKLYLPGVLVVQTETNMFTSLKSQLLSAANGGDASLFGQTKASFPYLQALQHNGSSISSTNFLSEILGFAVETEKIGRGMPDTIVISYKHWKSIKSSLDVQTTYTAEKPKMSKYGYKSVKISGVEGDYEFVAVREMADDVIFILDFDALMFYTTAGMFERVMFEGQSTFHIRKTTGHAFIVDHHLWGEFCVLAPAKCGVVHSISY